jgi:hypothetical protein
MYSDFFSGRKRGIKNIFINTIVQQTIKPIKRNRKQNIIV